MKRQSTARAEGKSSRATQTRLGPSLLVSLTVSWALAVACSPGRISDKRSAPDDPQGASPSPTPESTNKTGALQISLSQELSSSISSALVESGLTDAQAQAVTTEVKATGVIAIDTGAAGLAAEPGLSLNAPGSRINLTDYSLAEQTSALQTTAPSVAGSYVASLDAPAAGLSEEIRKNAIGIVTKATFDFTGKKAVDESSRSAILGDITQKVVEKTSEASLSPELLEDAVGVIADATFSNMERAGIPASFIGDTAKTLGAKIGEGLGKSGIQADRLPMALGKASEKASTALGKLSLSDPVTAIGSTTEGFVAGLAANASVSREIRMAAIAEVPKGISTAVPAWLPADKLENAVAQVTTSSFTTFINKLSPSAAEISDQAPRLAESSVTGLTRSGATAATLAASNVTAKPFQAIVEKMDSVGIDSTTRLKVVENTLSKSISALASSTDSNKLSTVGPQLVSRAFEVATSSRAKLGIDQTEGKVTSFYDTLLNGAIGGLAKAGSAQQAGTASAASAVLAKTMDAAVSSLNSMYTGTGAAISENILKSIPARAAQSAGEKLATVLPPDDLNGAFATVTTQYLYNVQAVVATKATNVDVSNLTKKVTATSLASFSGAFNARPVDMQTAVTALNNKMGVVGSAMDAKILAAVQGGTQEVVVNAVQSAGNVVGCSGATPNASLVVCSKVSTDICPIDTSENGYNLKWVADGTGERCFLYRELAVTTSQAVTCTSDSEYVYGIGCRRKVSTCAAGETFVYGVGCQAGTYFCSVGQKFLAGQGCVTDTADYSQCSAGTRRAADGNCVAIVATNCPIGATFNPNTKKCDAAATPQCPAGSTYNVGTNTCTVTIAIDTGSTTTACAAGFYRSSSGACLPFGRCDTGSYWDPSSLSCKSSASCTGNFQWDAGTNLCRAKDLVANLCPTGQFWDPTTQQCKSSTNCPANSSWDATARVCRPIGTCAIGFAYNPTNGTCDAVAQATVSECLVSASAPGTPILTVTPAVQSLGLSWAPASGETPTGYVLIRWDTSAGTLNLAEGKAYNIGDTVGSGTTLGKVLFRGKVTFFNDFAASDSSKEYAYSIVAANIPCSGPVYSSAHSVSGQKPLAAPSGTVSPPDAPSELSASSETDPTFQKRALLKWNAPLYVFGSQSIEPDFVIARIYDPSITPVQLKSFFAVDKQSYGQGSNIFNGSAAIGVVVFSGKLWRNSESGKPNYAFFDTQSSGSISGRYAIATKIGAGTSSIYSTTIGMVEYTAPSATEAVSVPKVTDLGVFIPAGASKPRVKWSAINGASGYIVARAPSSLAALPTLVNDSVYEVDKDIVIGGQTVAKVIGKTGQTSVDDVNLTSSPGNAYIYLVYTILNIDSKPKYSPVSSVTFVTSPSIPTASGIGATSLNLAWDGEDPASNTRIKYLLVRYPQNATTMTPPSPNQVYAAGSAIGDGSVVGYLSSRTATDAGLLASTSYKYQVFTAFDVTPSIGPRIIVYSLPQTRTITTATETGTGTSTGTGELTLTYNPTTKYMNLAWSTVSGVDGYIVVKLATGVTVKPSLVNGTNYANNAQLKDGTGTLLGTILTTTSTTTYQDTVPLNFGDACGYVLYTYNDSLSGKVYNEGTLRRFVTPPTGVVATSLGANSITLGWTGTAPTATNKLKYLVIGKQGSSPSSFTPVNDNIYTTSSISDGFLAFYGSDLSVSVSGLTALTQYSFKVFAAFEFDLQDESKKVIYSNAANPITLTTTAIGGTSASQSFSQLWSYSGSSGSPNHLKKIAISGGNIILIGQSPSTPSTPYRADFNKSDGQFISSNFGLPNQGILNDMRVSAAGMVAVAGTKSSNGTYGFVGIYNSINSSTPNYVDEWPDSSSEVQALAWDPSSTAFYAGGKSGASSFQIRKYVVGQNNAITEIESPWPLTLPTVLFGISTQSSYTINLIRRMVINNGNIILLADAVNDSATPSRISVVGSISTLNPPIFTPLVMRPMTVGKNLITDIAVDVTTLYFVSSSDGLAKLEKLTSTQTTPTSLNIYPADPSNSSFTAGYTSITIDGNGKLVVGGWTKEKSAESFTKGLFSRFATTGIQDQNLPKIWGGDGGTQFGDEMVTTILTDENKDIYVGGSTYTTATSLVERLIKFSGN